MLQTKLEPNMLKVVDTIVNNKKLHVVYLDSLWSIPGVDLHNYKIREFDEVFRKTNVEYYGSIGSSQSESSLIVLNLARLYGKKAVIYYLKKSELPEKFSAYDNAIFHYIGGRLSVGKYLAYNHFTANYDTISNKRNAVFIGTGTKHQESLYKSVSDDARGFKFLDNKRVHINIGSGMTLFSILDGLLRANIHPIEVVAYQTGMTPQWNKYRSITDNFKIRVIRVPWEYQDQIWELDLNPHYDGKVLRYLRDNNTFDDGDYMLSIGSSSKTSAFIYTNKETKVTNE